MDYLLKIEEECSLYCDEDSSEGNRLGLFYSKTYSTIDKVKETEAFGLFGHLSSLTLA
jgi:hypothetical protein